MNRKLTIAIPGLALVLTAFVLYPGAPRWPLGGNGFHYVVDLNSNSFPPSSVWDVNAQYALSDWRDFGSTAFRPAFRRSTANGFVNNDGINAWMWSNQPAQGWLGITYYRYSGGNMVEADVVYNSRADYAWTNGQVDPCKDRPYWPIDFRSVARHETGHAIGLDHSSNYLATMNPLYERGTGIPHTGASGELPHTDDKFGGRFLYANASTVYNLMATCWRPNGGQALRLSVSGSYAAGSQITVPVYIENQSNASFAATQRLGIYLSADDTISTFDTRIASIQFSGAWSFHAEQLYQFTVPIPATTTPGTWHVGAIIDWDNSLAERYEGDNAARLGAVTVTPAPQPDLIVESIALANPRPQRGGAVAMTAVVRNRGAGAATAATSTDFYVKSWTGPSDVTWSWPVGQFATPPLAANATHTIQATILIPPHICAEQTFYLHGAADFGKAVGESDESNNWRDLGFTPSWETGPGFAIGQMKTTLDVAGNDSITLCAKGLGGLPQNTSYFLLWGCSGSSPGIPLPPFGILPLNYDLCTEVGLAVEGLRFHGMRGPLASAPPGSLGRIDGGAWLKPLQTGYVQVAGLVVDTSSFRIAGVAPQALSFYIR